MEDDGISVHTSPLGYLPNVGEDIVKHTLVQSEIEDPDFRRLEQGKNSSHAEATSRVQKE